MVNVVTSEAVYPSLVTIALTVVCSVKVNAPLYNVPLVDEGVVPSVV